jgi:hypothetical protein
VVLRAETKGVPGTKDRRQLLSDGAVGSPHFVTVGNMSRD